MHRASLIPAALTVALLVGGGVPGLEAGQSEDPRADRDRVREEQAEVARRIDALEADEADVSAALADLETLVAAKSSQLEDAERALAAAEEEESQARAGEEEARRRIQTMRGAVADTAVDAYIRPPGTDQAAALEGDGLLDSALREALLSSRSGRQQDVLDQLAEAQEDLEIQLEVAEDASRRAEERQATVQNRLAELEDALGAQQALAAQVESRINAALAESAALAELDEQLSDQIAEEQAALAAQLAAQAEAAEAASSRARASGGTGAPPASGPSYNVGGVNVTTVGGITVATSIAGQVQSLLAAASADGLSLSGSGYRDPQRQIELRMAHCGTSHYAIYQMPASSCSPPTAIPGSSLHERGLAIDFSNCSYRSTACYQWLAGNASRFGLYNLPSEPWHWSTTGG